MRLILLLLTVCSAAPTDYIDTKALSWIQTTDNCVSAKSPASKKRVEVWTHDPDIRTQYGYSNVHVKEIKLSKNGEVIKVIGFGYFLFFDSAEESEFMACAETGTVPLTIGIRFSDEHGEEL